MRNVYKIIVLCAVSYISQQVEITTFEPANSADLIPPIHHEELASNETKARPSFHPKPGGVTQIIPPGSPSPDSPNATTLISETLRTTTEGYVKPQTVLEYKPLKPFHQPLPIIQSVPPGKPWPQSAEGNETVKPTKSPPVQTFPQDLVDRFPELTTLNKRPTTPNVVNNKEQEITTENNYVKPVTVLGYKPITSFYYPHPVTLPQIIPPGKPWPASAEGYETTTGSSGTTFRPELVSRKTTTAKITQSKKTKVPFVVSRKTTTPKASTSKETTISATVSRKTTTPKVSTSKETTISDLVSIKTTTEDSVKPTTVLEYKPITTFFHPHPVTLPQIIPPGKPWPESVEGYQTTKGSSPAATSSPIFEEEKVTTEYVESQTVLEYEPITSFYHPHPVTIAQIVPPGKPWPASAEETQTNAPTTNGSSQTLAPHLVDKFPELVSIKTTTTKTTENKTTKKPAPTVSSVVTPTSPTSTRIILTYKPQRPWYHPRPGNTIGQIVPPGKPWPSSPAGYPSFSVTTHPPWLKESIDKDEEDNELSLPHYKVNELPSFKEERSLEPNALQYYGPPITAPPTYNIPPTPFTSGTQKTTISDIVDILKEVHNITLVSGNAAPKPSHLLPFDVDKASQIGSPVVRRPPSKGNSHRQTPPPVQVYDGALNFNSPANRERIFSNPKFAPEQ